MKTAEDVYGPLLASIPANRGAEWAPILYWEVPGTPLPVLRGLPVMPGPPSMTAYLNHGRWVVQCPDCQGAQLACFTDRRFLCNYCGNVAVEGRWRIVQWPPNWKSYEGVLKGRPVANQNWVPGETLDDLIAQGLPEPRTRPFDPTDPHRAYEAGVGQAVESTAAQEVSEG